MPFTAFVAGYGCHRGELGPAMVTCFLV